MSEPEAVEPSPRPPGFVTRIGLALLHPRWALAIASDRAHTGRSGTDLIAVIALVLAATQLRGLATAVWLGTAVASGFGMRAAVRVLSDALVFDLSMLVVGALAIFGLAGARRSLGRAFDLACVAVLPLLFVRLAATVLVQAARTTVSPAVSALLVLVPVVGMGAVIVLAIRPARTAPARVPPPPPAVAAPARMIGWCVIALAVLGTVTQTLWIAMHLDRVKPMKTGEPAPAFALAEIGPTGALGDRVALASTLGKVTVLDFWATWCGPCLASMPRLEKLARSHADVAVLTINLDDAPAARALFDQRGYTMKLLADDGDTSDRYGVSSIPHTVIIDRAGAVREVVRGADRDLAALVDSARASQ